MLNFLAKTENLRSRRSEHPNYNRLKVPKKAAEITRRVEPSYPEIGRETTVEEEYNYSNRTRLNPHWKGGQLGCPNGSD